MRASPYPGAVRHLAAAQQAVASLGDHWAAVLDADPIDFDVIADADGAGRIVARIAWPEGSRERLTLAFRSCVDELWQALDCLVRESAALLRFHRPMPDTDSERYFPVADGDQNLELLLADGCLDGILRSQASMILDCQPYRVELLSSVAADLRIGLHRLVQWSSWLDSGSRVGAWITPGQPDVSVAAPASVTHVVVGAVGELVDEYVAATFGLDSYQPGSSLSAMPNGHVDVGFAPDFEPQDDDDTLFSRLNQSVATVATFISYFGALLADSPAGADHIEQRVVSDAAHQWRDAVSATRRWTSTDLDELANSDLGLAVVAETDELTLLVSSGGRVYERIIPNATLLPPNVEQGIAAEGAARSAAGLWGLPDFVIRPSVEQKGRGVREISDGLLLVGTIGVCLQVKSRLATGTPSRESSWLTKKIAESEGQASGTIRRLTKFPTAMVNARGREVIVDGATLKWLTVIVIDYPDPSIDFAIPPATSETPRIVLLRRDWEFLFDQLRSTYAVVRYLLRVGDSTEKLGGEPLRYYELAAHDEVAANDEGQGESSVPLLPTAPPGNDAAFGIVRILCEDIATSPTDQAESARLTVLAAIDSLPVAYRTDLGIYLLDGLKEATQHDVDSSFWKFRTFRVPQGQVQLGFGVCSRLTDVHRQAFRSWFLLRHHERGGDLTDATSIGVLLTPRMDGLREWDTTMLAITGNPNLSDEELQLGRELWNGTSSE